MGVVSGIAVFLRALFLSRAATAAENPALRQQLAVTPLPPRSPAIPVTEHRG